MQITGIILCQSSVSRPKMQLADPHCSDASEGLVPFATSIRQNLARISAMQLLTVHHAAILLCRRVQRHVQIGTAIILGEFLYNQPTIRRECNITDKNIEMYINLERAVAVSESKVHMAFQQVNNGKEQSISGGWQKSKLTRCGGKTCPYITGRPVSMMARVAGMERPCLSHPKNSYWSTKFRSTINVFAVIGGSFLVVPAPQK